MGSAFSDALEAWDSSAVDHTYAQFFDDDPDLMFTIGNEVDIVRALATAYIDRYDRHEREWEIPEQMIGACSFVGYIDGVVEPGVLVEDKLKGMWTPADETALALDDQVTGYIAMYCMLTGHDPDDVTVLYRVTKKPGIKQRQGETPEAYISRLAGDLVTRPEFYFKEFELSRTLTEVSGWWSMTRKVAAQIEQQAGMDPDEAWPESFGACKRFGSLCDFWEICSARDDTELDAVMNTIYQVREDR